MEVRKSHNVKVLIFVVGKLKENRGSTSLLMLYLLMVLLLFFALYMEYVSISATYDRCVQEVERGANINLEYYMADSWRQYGLAMVLEDEELKNQALAMIYSRLELDNLGRHFEGGQLRYTVSFGTVEVKKETPSLLIEGVVSIYPRLLARFTGPVSIDFSVSTRNVGR